MVKMIGFPLWHTISFKRSNLHGLLKLTAFHIPQSDVCRDDISKMCTANCKIACTVCKNTDPFLTFETDGIEWVPSYEDTSLLQYNSFILHLYTILNNTYRSKYIA